MEVMKTSPKVERRTACPPCFSLEAWAMGEAGLRGRLYVRLMDWETDHAPAWRRMLASRRRRFLKTEVNNRPCHDQPQYCSK